jgi:uncharacterized protein
MSASLPAHLTSLLRPEAYPHPVGAVRLVETHISWVFLTGEFAYKVKRPVRYPFVDLRSPAQRAFFCAEELRLNRRFAADLYLEVCAVTLENGRARISGAGEVIDQAVRMRQFRLEDELGSLLGKSPLPAAELTDFGRDLAARHEQLPVAGSGQPWGRSEAVRAALWQNLIECLDAARSCDAPETVRALSDAYRARLASAAELLAGRREAGRVRECHGDLHAGNIVRYGGRLLAFDCMEFEPAFRWIDVAEEIACLYMDLLARQHPAHAQAFLGGYLFECGDYQACRLLRLYGTHRALVRAKVAALRAAEAAPGHERAGACAEYRRYAAAAQQMLAGERPLLVLMCGVAGSGKSWLAERLAPRLGAIHLRSDVERKRIAGLAERQRSGSPLREGLYSAGKSERVYERLRQCAADVLAGGLPVIVDATFQSREQRALLRTLAAECAVSLAVVFCHAPREVLEARVTARERAASDASEAGREVLEWQQARFEPVSSAEDLRVIDADTTGAEVVSQVLGRLRQGGG